jgi:Tol biopolymer transport system component
MLPNGEPVQLTHDQRLKCCMAFSPDGSRLAYSVIEDGTRQAWSTYTVPVLGGDAPKLLLSNAAGLTWLDHRRVLFSEIRTGFHMGIVTATEQRSEYRKIYFPAHERAMAHYSYVSPNRKWALVLEMDPLWQPCRVVPMIGSAAGRQVGPSGPCTSAAWSPNGKRMYFSAEINQTSHLWRQRFPSGEPEQITFGPTEEEGVAVAPDGRSLVTSIGMHESEIWLHDTSGDRRLSSEGFAEPMRLRASPFPSARFSGDGKSLFYLTRRNSDSAPSELWRMDLKSGKSEALLPGITMAEYDLSTDLKEVVFSTRPDGRTSELWLAPLDRSAQPKRIAAAGAASPQFGPDDQVLFQWTQGTSYYLARIKKDGSSLEKVTPQPVGNVWGISPDRRWVVGYVMPPENVQVSSMAIPVTGDVPRRICETTCPVAWAPDGRFLYVGIVPKSLTSAGTTLAIPVPAGEALPKLPKSGIRGIEDVAAFAGARVIEGWMISPGPDPTVFAYTKLTTRRNLFRIPLPER